MGSNSTNEKNPKPSMIDKKAKKITNNNINQKEEIESNEYNIN
jgi:hypothetical protein